MRSPADGQGTICGTSLPWWRDRFLLEALCRALDAIHLPLGAFLQALQAIHLTLDAFLRALGHFERALKGSFAIGLILSGIAGDPFAIGHLLTGIGTL